MRRTPRLLALAAVLVLPAAVGCVYKLQPPLGNFDTGDRPLASAHEAQLIASSSAYSGKTLGAPDVTWDPYREDENLNKKHLIHPDYVTGYRLCRNVEDSSTAAAGSYKVAGWPLVVLGVIAGAGLGSTTVVGAVKDNTGLAIGSGIGAAAGIAAVLVGALFFSDAANATKAETSVSQAFTTPDGGDATDPEAWATCQKTLSAWYNNDSDSLNKFAADAEEKAEAKASPQDAGPDSSSPTSPAGSSSAHH
jgi:hypothetical protein